MKVRQCMCNQVSSVKANSTVHDVAKVMLDKHIGCVPVCDDSNNVVGLVTDRDLILRSLASEKDIKQTQVSEIMTTKVYNISPDADVEEASKIMCDCQVRRIPVIENDNLVGIITLGDLANNNINPKQVSSTVEGIFRCGHNAKNAE